MLARKQFMLALSSTLAQEGYEACQKAMHGSSRGGQSDSERTARNRRRDKRLVKETTPAHFASRGWIRREDCRDGAAHKTIAGVTSSNITSSNRRCAVGKSAVEGKCAAVRQPASAFKTTTIWSPPVALGASMTLPALMPKAEATCLAVCSSEALG